MQVSYSAGLVAFTPSGSNPTPIVCGVLQDVSLKSSYTLSKLFGQLQHPVAIAKGQAALSGTAKFAQLYGSFLKGALGGTLTGGQTIGAINEQATIPATPYQVTVVNSATFVADLSVYDFTASLPMTRVASSPATGQYSVSAGVYTFAAADTTHKVGINYSYTATGGETLTVTNQLMGNATTFTALLFNNFNGQNSGVKLYSVALGGIDLTLKNTDFTMQDISFEGCADASGNVMDIYTAE